MSNEFDYSKVKQATSVDQSDRNVPYNLRQSGPTKVEMLISTRVRKNAYWHLSMKAGCWRATVYNRVYHPRGYVKPEDGGAMVEYDAIVNHVTMWNVACERQIRVKGPDAEKFTDYVITRDATKISPMRARYVILCNAYGGVLNDPILLRISKDEFWFSLSDSDIGLYLQGVNADGRFNVDIDEIDVSPVQIQGPKSTKVLQKLCGDEILNVRYYWTLTTNLEGNIPVVISRTGWTGEVGYEITLRDASKGDQLWNLIMEAGKEFNIRPTPPCEIRRVEAGIFNWGQDMTFRDNPYQMMGLERLVEDQEADYIGKKALEKIKKEGVKRKLVGLIVDGDELKSQLREFWPIVEDNKQIAVT